MNDGNKTPLDLMDDIYSLAYWMTGSEKSASDLFKQGVCECGYRKL